MIETQIIDNALNSHDFEKIQAALTVGNMFPWFWNDSIAANPVPELLKNLIEFHEFGSQIAKARNEDNYYFTHQFYGHFAIHEHEANKEEYNSNKEAALQQSTLKHWPMTQPLLDLLNPSFLIRVKANLYLRTDEIEHHNNHTDYPFEHRAAILYINTNNGLTVLEDGTECESVANRLLLFDGSKLHHSTTCTDQKRRVNINMNYM